MRLYDSRMNLQVLEQRECLDHLRTEVIGRLGVIDGGAPLVLPVNYAMHGDQVVFRTGPGAKLDAHRGQACFEIDGYDAATRSGWSVVVRGHLEEVTRHDSGLLAEIEDLADPWMDDERPNILRLVPVVITGRRIPPGPAGVS